ncbi:hypothetical protein [Gracilibacillus halophilus]|nr:hypothetical protein [Gracilibacillus halophilus]
MSVALVVVGVIVIIISVISGLSTGALFGFFIWLTGGVSVSLILFAFSQIIENQLNILYQLQVQNRFTRQLHKASIQCPNCDYEYDDTLTSCPNCGHREQSKLSKIR